MLDTLTNLVKEITDQAVENTTEIPNEQAGAIAQEATSSIFDELKNAVSGGGLSGVLGMLQGKDTNVSGNPASQNILSNLTNKLTQKFGLSEGTAQSLGSSIIPSVLSKLTGKINDPNDNSIDLNSAISSLTDGKLGNITSFLDKNGDGKVNLSDAMALLGGANNSSSENNSGGILNKLKGIFGG